MFKKLFTWLGKKRKSELASSSRMTLTSVMQAKRPEEIHFHWHFTDIAQMPTQFTWHAVSSPFFSKAIDFDVSAINSAEEHDLSLLDRARTQWQFGDWKSLMKLERDTLKHHPERAKLALLVAAAHMQQGDMMVARQFTRLAQDWGCSKKLVSQILIAGVHNSLGRAAAIMGQLDQAQLHFDESVRVGMSNGNMQLIGSARGYSQLDSLGLK